MTDNREPRLQWRGPLWILFYAAAVSIPFVRVGWGTPQWLVLLAVALAVLTFYVYDAVAAERKRLTVARHAAGRCPTCGYDLRASPLRCPECGGGIPACTRCDSE